jgi:hypothetical protein
MPVEKCIDETRHASFDGTQLQFALGSLLRIRGAQPGSIALTFPPPVFRYGERWKANIYTGASEGETHREHSVALMNPGNLAEGDYVYNPCIPTGSWSITRIPDYLFEVIEI